MAFTTNYAGRDVDLLIFQNTKPVGEQKLELGFGTGGEITTGVQKMAQTFTLLLLTELGSIQYHPNLGTDFITNVRLQAFRDETDVRAGFGLAVAALLRTMALEATRAELPDDETLDTVELLDVQIDPNKGLINLKIRLTSLAGVDHDFFLPVPVAIQ